ncbi:MAG: BadF/BadG/BcrA/BcrD ATPase family protein, partial [Gordonia amarae]
MTASRLLVDAGQTGTRLRVIGADGHVIDTVAGPVDTHHDVVDQVADRVRETLSDNNDRIGEVAVGLSGLTDDAARPDTLRHRLAHFGVGRVILAHDSVTAYLAANGTHHGVVVAAGTGVVTLGVSPEGVARVDGWGHLLGDAGSAYWIGRAGLDAAMRAFDGRAEPTALMRAAIDEFGPLPDLYMVLQADPARVSRIAGFARTVDRLTGDTAAAAILD